MKLVVRVVAVGSGSPAEPGTAVRLEVRDVTEVDAPSVVVAVVDSTVELDESDGTASPATLATIDLDLLDEVVTGGRDLILWARVAASGADRTTSGDWITMQAVPIEPATASDSLVDVEVRRVD